MQFEYKQQEYLAIGLTNGNGIIKLADKLMTNDIVDEIITEKNEEIFRPFNHEKRRHSSAVGGYNMNNLSGNNTSGDRENSNNISVDLDEERADKITFIGYFNAPNRIIFGSKEGVINIYFMSRKETPIIFAMDDEQRAGMRRILQVVELPTKIADCRKHIYYILTHGNLYAMSKDDKSREILQQFYKQERTRYSRPRLLATNVIMMGN